MENSWKDLRREGFPENDNAVYKGTQVRLNRSGEHQRDQADSNRVGVSVGGKQCGEETRKVVERQPEVFGLNPIGGKDL